MKTYSIKRGMRLRNGKHFISIIAFDEGQIIEEECSYHVFNTPEERNIALSSLLYNAESITIEEPLPDIKNAMVLDGHFMFEVCEPAVALLKKAKSGSGS